MTIGLEELCVKSAAQSSSQSRRPTAPLRSQISLRLLRA